MKILIFIFSLLISMNLFAGDSHPHGTIALTVDHFQDNSGVALIFLFSSSDGFPDQSAKAVKTLEAKIRKGKLDASFMDIPYGVYAVSVLHDEKYLFSSFCHDQPEQASSIFMKSGFLP